MIVAMNIMEKALRPFTHMFQAAAKPAVRTPVKSSEEDTTLAAIAATAVELARIPK